MLKQEFIEKEGDQIAHFLNGKTIESFEIDDNGMYDYLIFKFTDGSVFRIHYDYIYSYEINDS